MILTYDQYNTAAKQQIEYTKTATRTTVAAGFFTLFDLAGQPGAGTLAVGNTANGVVPTGATAGYPAINTFGGGNVGELGALSWRSSVAGTIYVFDCLFAAGAYAYNANTSLTSQPSYSARVPGSDYSQCQIWAEMVTVATGNQAVACTYTNQADVTTQSTGAQGIGAAPTVGRCWQLGLAAGDSSVKAINSVTGSVATAGTFNIRVLRPLWRARANVVNGAVNESWRQHLRRQMYDTSALYVLFAPDSTSSGVHNIGIEVANG